MFRLLCFLFMYLLVLSLVLALVVYVLDPTFRMTVLHMYFDLTNTFYQIKGIVG